MLQQQPAQQQGAALVERLKLTLFFDSQQQFWFPCLWDSCAGRRIECVWEIPAQTVFVLHQHNSARKVFDELLHQYFLFLLILLDFS